MAFCVLVVVLGGSPCSGVGAWRMNVHTVHEYANTNKGTNANHAVFIRQIHTEGATTGIEPNFAHTLQEVGKVESHHQDSPLQLQEND